MIDAVHFDHVDGSDSRSRNSCSSKLNEVSNTIHKEGKLPKCFSTCHLPKKPAGTSVITRGDNSAENDLIDFVLLGSRMNDDVSRRKFLHPSH